MRTLRQLAIDEFTNFPLAAAVLQSDFYMDDVLTGSISLRLAKEIQRELIEILKSANMTLHKWCSNNPEFAVNVDDEYTFQCANEVSAFGVSWKTDKDCFNFKVKLENESKITKRQVLSTIARIFDPLGLLGPVIAKAKIFLQRLRVLKLNWDDLLPDKEAKEWQRFFSELPHISKLEINRCILVAEAIVIELHEFCDAYELAYGAVVYSKSVSQYGEVVIRLVTSKSKVSPIKQVTIPRLELCAAVLLAKLMTRVISALKLNVNNVFFWSDSSIVLAWLKKEPCCMKRFVANRVAVVQEMTEVRQWHHVPFKQNPADLISRGAYPVKLQLCELRWRGPPFLL
ncbi:uncharacterized protein LOC118181366 [Stegodyphus dumicola]|uniref:uncharacterized protein LOC118181366 n=1 Tax=Stegodyphus dumicola TaxID=202533 RepID=UPI0015AF053D|nr:uncharacterized protein LOC118181366 [Stegodyphus dumicola]